MTLKESHRCLQATVDQERDLAWYAYVYDEYYGCILCLQNKVLSYATTNHEGYQKSKSYVCQSP